MLNPNWDSFRGTWSRVYKMIPANTGRTHVCCVHTTCVYGPWTQVLNPKWQCSRPVLMGVQNNTCEHFQFFSFFTVLFLVPCDGSNRRRKSTVWWHGMTRCRLPDRVGRTSDSPGLFGGRSNDVSNAFLYKHDKTTDLETDKGNTQRKWILPRRNPTTARPTGTVITSRHDGHNEDTLIANEQHT